MWKDSETKLDFLDFDYLTDTILKIVNNNKLSPSSIGIYGDWGSGKSSLMNMCFDLLSKEEDNLCIMFNGWLFEGYEDAKTALLGTILDKINKEKTLSSKAKNILQRLYDNTDKLKLASMGIKYGIDFFVTGGVGTLADITLKNIIPLLKEKTTGINENDIKELLHTNLQNKDLRKDIKSFQDNFSKLLDETNIKKLIVFIDELDRCAPSTILATLEAIRLFLFTKNTSFILGADERHVTYSVKTKYSKIEGNQIDIGKEYLEKMIQYPVRIPQLSRREVEFYILCLLFQKELSDENFNNFLNYIKMLKKENFIEFELTFDDLKKHLPTIAENSRETISFAKQIAPVLSAGLKGNPRHCKRFMNSLSMRENMASFRSIKVNRKVLAKIMLLEYFKPNLFNKLSILQLKQKGKPEELEKLENRNWNELEKFDEWKDDEWVTNWIDIDPKISNIDLRPYFYFSRESLLSQLNLGKYKLSAISEKVIENLFSGSDSQRNFAIKEFNNIIEPEAYIILEKISSKILSEQEISISLFRSFLDWGACSSSLSNMTINYLNEIPSNKINFSLIPRVKEFMDKTNSKDKINTIVSRWKKENPRLIKPINKNFEEE